MERLWIGNEVLNKMKRRLAATISGILLLLVANAPGWLQTPHLQMKATDICGGFLKIIICPDQDMVIVTRWLEPGKIGEFMKLVYKALD